jgi:hypothetical protein
VRDVRRVERARVLHRFTKRVEQQCTDIAFADVPNQRESSESSAASKRCSTASSRIDWRRDATPFFARSSS